MAGGNFSTINELQPAIEKLQTALADIGEPTPNVLVCGDFNLPNSVWDDNKCNSNTLSAGEYSMHEYLSNFMSLNFLNQYITKATHKNGNTLDLIFSNNSSLLHSYDCVIPALSSISDHFIIECKSILRVDCVESNELPTKSSALDYLNFFSNDIDWELISNQFKSIDWRLMLTGLSPDAH